RGRGQRGLGLGRASLAWYRLAGLCSGRGLARLACFGLVGLELVVAQGRQLDRVVMSQVVRSGPLQVDSRIAGAREVDSREVRIGRGHVRIAGAQRDRFKLVAGVQGAELEIAARVRLQRIDEIAGGIELEIAVRLGGRNLGRGTDYRAGPDGRVAGTGIRREELVIGGVILDQGDVRVAGLFQVGVGRGETDIRVARSLDIVRDEADVGVAGQLAAGLHADDYRARPGHRAGGDREVIEQNVLFGGRVRDGSLAAGGRHRRE